MANILTKISTPLIPAVVEAKKLVAEGHIVNALQHLDICTHSYLTPGYHNETNADLCLNEARQISANNTIEDCFRPYARFAAYSGKLGRIEDEHFFRAIVFDLLTRADPYRTEEICFASGLAYAKCGIFDKALPFGPLIRDYGEKYVYYWYIADEARDQNYIEFAEWVMMNRAVPQAIKNPDRKYWGRPQLVHAAERLFEMGSHESSLKVTMKVAEEFRSISWLGLSCSWDQPLMDRLAVLFNKLGHTDRAIELATGRGWIGMDAIKGTTFGELRDFRLELIHAHWPKLDNALNVSQ